MTTIAITKSSRCMWWPQKLVVLSINIFDKFIRCGSTYLCLSQQHSATKHGPLSYVLSRPVLVTLDWVVTGGRGEIERGEKGRGKE